MSVISEWTEMTDTMESLSPTARKFILHWGEMGVRWGINRTVGQIHALLLLSQHPLPADEIADTLAIARSNVSTSIRELQNWGVARLVHLAGDRRDHFESIKDLFAMFRVIARERKKREIDPTVRVLRECIDEAPKQTTADRETRARLAELLELFELGTSAYEQLEKLPTPALIKIAKLGDKAFRLLGVSRKDVP
jgi:DNA-binding transcriptional regulator GbsR (MarR family)